MKVHSNFTGPRSKKRLIAFSCATAWHYFYGDGTAATGAVQINGQKLYFDTNHGRQVKGAFAPDGHYYDENSGELVTNQTRTIKGVTYHFDENGNATKV